MLQTKGGMVVQNDIGKRIAELRRERGLSQEELAELAMLHRVTVAKYETGQVEPGALAIGRIADALGVSADELLCRVDKLPPFIHIVKGAVPIVGDIACGKPITAEQNIEGYAELPDGVSADFALRCKGDSMTPTFQPGDLVLIRQQPEVQPGQIAAVGIDGEATLKRFYKNENGIVLVADNPAYLPQVYTAGTDVCVYGLAVGFVRVW
jgi:repressor LexA